MVVIDEEGRLIEVEGDVVPEGCRLPVAALTMDAAEVAELRRRCEEAADEIDEEEEAEGGVDDGDDHDDEDDLTPQARAYLHAKMNLDYRTRRKRDARLPPAGSVPAPRPDDPSWKKGRWKARRGRVEVGGTDSVPDAAVDA